MLFINEDDDQGRSFSLLKYSGNTYRVDEVVANTYACRY